MNKVLVARQQAQYLLELSTQRELTREEYLQCLDICNVLLKDIQVTIDSWFPECD